MEVKGNCLICGCEVRKETNHPEQWTQTFRGQPQSIWVICPNIARGIGQHIGGVIFKLSK